MTFDFCPKAFHLMCPLTLVNKLRNISFVPLSGESRFYNFPFSGPVASELRLLCDLEQAEPSWY